MVLFRSQLQQLIHYLQLAFATDHNKAYELAMRALNRVINTYYGHGDGNAPIEDIIRDENHWSHYDRFKRRLNLVRKLYAENPYLIEEAFQSAYQAIVRVESQLAVKLEGEKDVSMEELVLKLSEVFAGGFYSRLAHSYQTHLADVAADASVVGKFGEVLDAANPNSLPELALKGLMLYQKLIATPKQTEGHKKFLETLKLIINEAIELLAKREACLKNDLRESQDEPRNDIFNTVDKAFCAYIAHQLQQAGLSIEAGDNYLRRVLELFHRPDLSPAQKVVCKNVRSEVFKYFQVDGKPEGFGIINPRLLLDSKTLEKDKQYQAVKQYSSEELSKALMVTVQEANKKKLSAGSLYDINVSLGEWGSKRNVIQRVWQAMRPGAQNHPNSERSQERDRLQLMGYFESLAQSEGSGLDKFADVLFALNQKLSPRYLSATSKSKASTTFSHHPFLNINQVVDPATRLHKDLRRVQYFMRDLANAHADKIKCLLTQHAKITKQDFYFELNLNMNYTIGNITKSSYGFASFPLSLVGKIRPGMRKDRESRLEVLTKQLVQCRNENDYVNLFDAIINNWAQVNRGLVHPWDGQFYNALKALAKRVVGAHVLSKHRFTLDFNVQQLRRIAIHMQCMNMRKEKVYLALQDKIKQIETENEQRPDELQVERALTIGEANRPAEEIREMQKQASDARKIKLFEDTLKTLLESQILADLVISTGRLQVKDRDIGNIAAQLADVVGKVNGLVGVANLVRNVGHQMDEKRQEADGQEVGNKITAAGGYLVWDQISKLAVEKLSKMFAAHIKEMDSENAPVRFAEFCFKRIHASLYAPLPQQAEELSPSDRLVYAVFTQDEKLSNIPFRQDHYRKMGDPTRFTNTTFKGLVENVAFICEASARSEVVSQQPAAPERPDMEPIAPQASVPAVAKATELYVEPSAFNVKGDSNVARSKFSKYGAVPGDVKLATALRRVPLGLFENRVELRGQPHAEQEKLQVELAKNVRVNNRDRIQEELVRGLTR